MQVEPTDEEYHQHSLLAYHFKRYSVDRDIDTFVRRVSKTYTPGSLERLATSDNLVARRGALLCLAKIADYRSNNALGQALTDSDQAVRTLAETGLWNVWMRAGTSKQQKKLGKIAKFLEERKHEQALDFATELIEEAPNIAQAWYFRSRAYYQLERYEASTRDSQHALFLNKYHYSAASLMGQAYSRMDCLVAALDCFRLALQLNPNMEEAREQVKYLERTLMVG